MQKHCVLSLKEKRAVKVRTRCFSDPFRKNFFFFDIVIPFEKIFPGNVQLFQNSYWKWLNLRENDVICVITVIKVHDLLLTLSQLFQK